MKTKNIFLLFILLSTLAVGTAIAQKPVKVTFKYKFTNVQEGYDHISRLKVYVDNSEVGVSIEKKESESNTLSVMVPKGYHTITAVVETKYEGNWEEHTKENQYSVDCIFERSKDFKKNMNVQIEFDIESESMIIKKEK